MKFCMGCMEQYEDGAELCPHCGYVENTPPATPLQMVPGSILADRYIVGKSIGSGGFGVTYIGWDAVLETKVAIKEYLPSEFSTRACGKTEITVFEGDKQEQFSSGMARFIDEAKKLAKFGHVDGIVHIFDSFEVNNTAYIIMELLEGETLAQRLERDNTIPQDEAVKMLLPVMRALGEVHKSGIIHRDIAPDNIFVTNEGNIKLIDFGAARFATTTHSRSLSVLVKPGYSPEEQYESRGEQGPHTDVYSLAATMYRMITGKCPPTSIERMAKVRNRKRDPLVPISKLVPDIDENYETAIMNALNVRINDRTENMDKFAEELTSEMKVKRRASNISKIINLRWPLWAKIGVPVAAAALVTFGVLFVTGVIGFNANLKKDIVIPDGQTRVPSVISEEYDIGNQRLQEANLQVQITGRNPSDKIPEDLILTQTVMAGTIVPKNTIVEVTVSEGIIMTEMPNVYGMQYDQAKELLEGLGFKVDKMENYHDFLESGCVVSQSAEAGKKAEAGATIVLTVSKGIDPEKVYDEKIVKIPDVTGKNYNDAMKELGDLGLIVGISESIYSKDVPKDHVISQNPTGGSKVRTSDKVSLVVSKGYGKIEVPDVTFTEEKKASSKLKSLGFKVSVKYENSDSVAEGLVISQNPKKSTMLDPESVVTIVVSKGAAAFEMPNVVGMDEANAKSTLTGKGLSVTVNYESSNSYTEGEVLSQSISKGTMVKKGTSVTITVCTRDNVISVPNVVGKSRRDAESSISNAGLKYTVVEVYSESVSSGNVISQYPAAGANLLAGDNVTLNVSKGKEPAQTTTANTSTPTTPASTPTTPTSTPTAPTSTPTTVEEIQPSSISLDKNSLTLYEGDSQQLTAVVSPNNANNKSVTWSSDNTSVATVSNGLVTAKGIGTAKITAKTYNGKTVVCTITVKEPAQTTTANTSTSTPTTSTSTPTTSTPTSTPTTSIPTTPEEIQPSSISLDKTSLTLYEGDSQQLTAVVSPNNANNKSVTWSSDNTSVATVSNGLVTAKSIGTAKITAKTYNGKTVVCTITVKDPWEGNTNDYGLEYTVLADNTLEVSCPAESKETLTAAVIPSEFNGRKVTSIGEQAFYNCTNLTSVTIPKSVTSIDDYAFYKCYSLTSVTIPDSVTSIGREAFYNCIRLTKVTIPDSVTSIGSEAFDLCTSLTTVTIPDSVIQIDIAAFSHCYSLTTVTIPKSVTSIGDYAFYKCESLTSVTIPDSVTSIGTSAFGRCTSLTAIEVDEKNAKYSSKNGVLFNKDKTELVQYPSGKTDKSYTIPDSVTSIGSGAFSDCSSLTTVTIPNSVTSIGNDAFYDCTSLVTVTIPNSVTSIGWYAFGNCQSLKNVYYSGTEEQWKAIKIDSGNGYLTNRTIHYKST